MGAPIDITRMTTWILIWGRRRNECSLGCRCKELYVLVFETRSRCDGDRTRSDEGRRSRPARLALHPKLPPVALALGRMVFSLSLGATFLLFSLIWRGAATAVASLIYLCSATTAVLVWLAFGEDYTAWAAAGMVSTAAGVWLAGKA